MKRSTFNRIRALVANELGVSEQLDETDGLTLDIEVPNGHIVQYHLYWERDDARFQGPFHSVSGWAAIEKFETLLGTSLIEEALSDTP